MRPQVLAFLAATALSSGCKVVDAPNNLEELAVYAFAGFDDARRLDQAAQSFPPLVTTNVAALQEGYRVTDLTAADLAEAGVDGADVTGVLGAMGTVTYASDLVDVLSVITSPDIDVHPGTNVQAFEVWDSTDRDCFLERRCPRFVQQVVETNRVPLIGEVTREYEARFAWGVDAEGNPVAWEIVLSPTEAEIATSLVRLFQQYQLVLLYEDEGVLRRLETFWVDAVVIGLEVPDTLLVDNAISAMGDAAEQVDATIAGTSE